MVYPFSSGFIICWVKFQILLLWVRREHRGSFYSTLLRAVSTPALPLHEGLPQRNLGEKQDPHVVCSWTSPRLLGRQQNYVVLEDR